MARVIVLGAGLGGIPAALDIRSRVRSEDQVTVINNTDKYSFIPSNPWVAVGWRKPEKIEVPLAGMFEKRHIEFIATAARRVLPEANQIELIDGRTLDYDFLVISTGPDLAFDEVPGLGPMNGFTQSICQTEHACRAFDAWQRFLESPGPIVVGAAQGASCFGPAYEFCMVMETELRHRKIRHKVPITFVTPEPYIGHLGLGGVGDTKGLLESIFRNHDIKWICNSRVEEITPDTVSVTEVNEDGQIHRNHQLPHAFSMLIPAFRGAPAVAGIEGLVNPRGFVVVDAHQRNPEYRNVFALGVCMALAPVEKTAVPVGVPKTGFMIESMGAAIALNISALIEGGEATYEPSLNALCLADFGNTGVGFVAIPQIPPRNVNWSSHGWHIHLGKIAFEKYFLHKVRSGVSEPFYERTLMKMLGIEKLQ
jgi:sulfide:quinone oxidoreductase